MNLVVKGAVRGIEVEEALLSKVPDDLFSSIIDGGLDLVHALDV
jgi:hypothetical protein